MYWGLLFKDSTWKILCEFVDAGNGKECSDAKIRGEIVLFLVLKVNGSLT